MTIDFKLKKLSDLNICMKKICEMNILQKRPKPKRQMVHSKKVKSAYFFIL